MVVFKASRFLLTGITPTASKSSALNNLLVNGFIHPVGKGLFSLLPLGQRVIARLARIIDEELESIGAMKVSFPIIGPRGLWEKTNRWNSMGPEMIHFKDRTGAELCLQPTAEEMCTQMVAQLPQFKKTAFPLLFYQTMDKFRDEMNPRFGLLRAREFIMKDLYSFDINDSCAIDTYELVSQTYENILTDRLNLPFIKVRADSGVHGGKLSHEYHITNSLEEDSVSKCLECNNVWKEEESSSTCANCSSSAKTERISTVEVAHTFQLGTKYSEILGAVNMGKPMEMCCYGIGVSRLLPVVVELLSPSDHIRVPKQIAPFDAAVIVTKSLLSNVLVEMTVSTMNRHLKGGILLDDRTEINVGKRLKELSRIGIPRIIVLGKRTEDSMNGTAKMELFTTEANKEELNKMGEFTLNQLMQILNN